MSLRKGFGAELALPHGNDLRYDLAGTVVRDSTGAVRGGLFPPVGTLLTSSATMAVNVAAFSGVAVRDGGPVFLANDGSATVTPDAAPSSNSRLDVIYAKQNDASSYVTTPDSDNTVNFGILKGVASASPVRNPAGLPAGALELGTILIPSTATNSGSAGVVITPTFLYTCMAGGVLLVRNAAELTAWAPSDGAYAQQLDTGVLNVRSGGVWGGAGVSPWAAYTPALTGVTLGTGGTAVFAWRRRGSSVEVSYAITLGTGGTFAANPTFGLPVAAIALSHPYKTYSGRGSIANAGQSSVVTSDAAADNTSTTTFRIYTGGNYTPITNTSPHTFAAGSVLQGEFTYRTV